MKVLRVLGCPAQSMKGIYSNNNKLLVIPHKYAFYCLNLWQQKEFIVSLTIRISLIYDLAC